LRLPHHEGHKASDHKNCQDDANDFFHMLIEVRKSPLTVYATVSLGVPGKCLQTAVIA